jgi:PTH2 family peptidyl-tRNA hydrolase
MNDKKVKQVIVMRKDLNMRKGKMIAQGAHASMKVLVDSMPVYPAFQLPAFCDRTLRVALDTPMDLWLRGLFTKIVVGVNSDVELFKIYTTAVAKGIKCSLIEDAGKTEFNGMPTYTCCAIGPDFEDVIDEITGGLPLL